MPLHAISGVFTVEVALHIKDLPTEVTVQENIVLFTVL
jgi:hypothetical protein